MTHAADTHDAASLCQKSISVPLMDRVDCWLIVASSRRRAAPADLEAVQGTRESRRHTRAHESRADTREQGTQAQAQAPTGTAQAHGTCTRRMRVEQFNVLLRTHGEIVISYVLRERDVRKK